DPRRGRREVKISSRGLHSIAFGTHSIDLGAVEQLVDASQTRAIGDAIYRATGYMDGERTLGQIVDALLKDLGDGGLDGLGPGPVGDRAAFRGLELAAAINRLRTLAVQQVGR
ncbi:MAG: ATPase, partial [Dehalococcoidia bacterium]